MCGFAGILTLANDASPHELRAEIAKMAATLRHRGPDSEGEWSDAETGIALGFRRLAILDLSSAGEQPMVSPSGRYVIAFNGEVYNFTRIRKELENSGLSSEFRGHSDTEVLLSAIEAWGVVGAVRRCIGMFAFALWDRSARELHLVRDRLGVKPLYVGRSGGPLLFGSELKALIAHPSFNGSIDRTALTLYLRHGYVPGPYSIYEGIQKLAPGTILTISSDGVERSEKYWSAVRNAEAAVAQPFSGSEDEALEELNRLLLDSTSLRMISDVPLGVFLSGGVDSSLVAALMQAQSTERVKTFTIGFSESAYNEAPYARRVSEHLGTEHVELCVTPSEAMGVIPSLPTIYDEPFADSSQIPTYLVSALARRHVAVSLSGDGGDELFGGYSRHLLGTGVWRSATALPSPVRRAASGLIRSIGAHRLESAVERIQRVLPARMRVGHPGEKLMKLANVLQSSNPDDIYRNVVSIWPNPQSVAVDVAESGIYFSAPGPLKVPGFAERMMLMDLVTYLVDDILVKVDRASMSVSLEAREPLLDHRIAEFALSLPLDMKIRDGRGKWILRQVLQRYVPAKLMERPKVGFGIPLDEWLRGPLRPWAEELLGEARLNREGFFDAAVVRRTWSEHLNGKPQQHKLWAILMFNAWLDSRRQTPADLSGGDHDPV